MLQSEYAIKTVRHSKYPNLVLFKYSMTDSPMGEDLVQECRGLILAEHNNWAVVSYPFKKFFNYGEGHAAQIDWATATVQEKLDGSLICVYFYDGQWQIQTSGTPDGSGEVQGWPGYTFKQLFLDTLKLRGYRMPDPSLHRFCFMFELTTPLNRVVVRHQDADVHLIGMRLLHSKNLNDPYPEVALSMSRQEWPKAPPVAQVWQLDSLAGILDTFSTMDPLQQEGYVVVDQHRNRIKVKHPGYVAIHHLKDGFGPRRILEIIRSGESSEVVTHFPEWKEHFDRAQGLYQGLVDELEETFARHRGVESQKEFALLVQATRCPAALFQMRSGKVQNVREYLANMNIRHLQELLKFKDFELPGSGV
jgi:hypothetical protein